LERNLSLVSLSTTEAGRNFQKKSYENKKDASCWWLTPIILATPKAKIKRIAVQSQPQANSSGDPISKKPFMQKGWWSGPKFKPQSQQKKKKVWVVRKCKS
jgi:hypothetical protein